MKDFIELQVGHIERASCESPCSVQFVPASKIKVRKDAIVTLEPHGELAGVTLVGVTSGFRYWTNNAIINLENDRYYA